MNWRWTIAVCVRSNRCRDYRDVNVHDRASARDGWHSLTGAHDRCGNVMNDYVHGRRHRVSGHGRVEMHRFQPSLQGIRAPRRRTIARVLPERSFNFNFNRLRVR